GPGAWVAPTVVEDVPADAALSCTELFGPVTILYRVRDLDEAIALVNESPYGLTSAIHTASLHRAMRFADAVEAGVVVVNGGPHGSEPHIGFGGVKHSGTGWPEAGPEALERVEAAPRFAVPLLNGIEHMQTLRERLSETTVVGASIGRIEAWLERPGVVVQPTPSVVMTVASGAPVELLRRSGVEVRENGSAAEVLWEKLARQAPTA